VVRGTPNSILGRRGGEYRLLEKTAAAWRKEEVLSRAKAGCIEPNRTCSLGDPAKGADGIADRIR
jgi:hypothetical protein